MTNDLQGPYVVVSYDGSGKELSVLTVDQVEGGLAGVWNAARVALPEGTRAFALYDGRGALARVGVIPQEPLTDGADTTALAMDDAGEWAATGHRDGSVRLWDLGTGEPRWTRTPADEPIAGVLFVERGPWVLAWADDGPLLLIERDSGELLTRVEDPQDGPFTVAVAPEGDEVAMTGMQVTRVALPEGAARARLDPDRARDAMPAHEAEEVAEELHEGVDEGVRWVAFLPEGAPLVGVRSESAGDEVVFWDRASGRRVEALSVEHGIGACDLSPDGKLVAAGLDSQPESVLFVDTTLRRIVRRVPVGGDGICDLRFLSNGLLAVQLAGVGVVRIDPATGETSAPLPETDGQPLLVPLDEPVIPDVDETPPIMVTRDSTGRVELTPLDEHPAMGPVGRASSDDGVRLAVVPYATDNNLVSVLDLVRGAQVVTLPHRANAQEVWLSPDGTRVAVRAAGALCVWRVPNVPATRPLARSRLYP